MKNILVVPNINKDTELSRTKRVVEKLISLGFSVFALKKHLRGIDVGAKAFDEIPENIDLIVVIGGDGSFIDASRYAIIKDIPILGVNLGRVGYLAEVDPENINILERLSSGEYLVNERMLLCTDAEGMDFTEKTVKYAVNDIVLSFDGTLGISSIRIEDKQGNSVKYRADGLIFSTPQGSTAYSLSAGGPILAHDVEGIVVSPVAPHSFFNRSVIFNSDEVIKVTNEGENALNISFDGRIWGKLEPKASIKIFKAEKNIKMVAFSKNTTFSNLFKKVRVLEDID